MFPTLFTVICMVKFDYFNWVGMERKYDCYSIFERQRDVTGQGLGFGF